MSLTKRQSEVMSDIQGGIACLKQEHPNKTKFLMGEVMERAGHDRSGIKLYAMVKYLRKHNKEKELAELRDMLLSVGVTVLPLEKWSQEKLTVEDKPDDLILMRQLDDEEVKPHTKRFAIVEKETAVEGEVMESEPCVNKGLNREIESLSEILKILAPLPRDKRESILSSAESFFSMGT